MEEAIEHLTEAILLNPTSAIMYGTRGLSFWFSYGHRDCFLSLNLKVYFLVFGSELCLICYLTASVYIKMKKPNAAIRDANAALEVVVLHLVCFYMMSDFPLVESTFVYI